MGYENWGMVLGKCLKLALCSMGAFLSRSDVGRVLPWTVCSLLCVCLTASLFLIFGGVFFCLVDNASSPLLDLHADVPAADTVARPWG